MLDHQDPEGTWAGAIYSPKWTSTTYTLLLLQRMGLDRCSLAAQRGVEVLWERARFHDGGVNAFRSLSIPEVCITAMYIKLATYFEYSDPRVGTAISWLLENQLADGGWNCDTLRTGDQHSSFHTTISTLEAFAQVRRLGEDGAIDEALEAGREFFLKHHLFRSHKTGKKLLLQHSRSCRFHLDGISMFLGVSTTSNRSLRPGIRASTMPYRYLYPNVQATVAGRFRTDTRENDGSRWSARVVPAVGTR